MSKQVNIRLENAHLQEIDILAKVLHQTRTDWLRQKVAEGFRRDIYEHVETIILEYSKGTITEQELVRLLGKNAPVIAEEVYSEYVKKQIQAGLKDIENGNCIPHKELKKRRS